MKILLTGANGQFGRCFQDIFPQEWQLIAANRKQLDITDQLAVESFILQHKPDIVVNGAAYTAVDKAELEPEIAQRVNTQAPYYLALACKSVNARFFHISTDYVFDGNQLTPYNEIDKTNPLSIYGKTKLKGEQLSQQANSDTTVIRTAWVFSEYGHNFVKTMLKLAKERDELNVIDDQIGCPTYAGDLATCIIGLIKQNNEAGIYHYCGDKPVSWFEFAKVIFKKANKLVPQLSPIMLSPLTTEQYPTQAKRPKNSTMDNSKIVRLGFVPSNWNRALVKVIESVYHE